MSPRTNPTWKVHPPLKQGFFFFFGLNTIIIFLILLLWPKTTKCTNEVSEVPWSTEGTERRGDGSVASDYEYMNDSLAWV